MSRKNQTNKDNCPYIDCLEIDENCDTVTIHKDGTSTIYKCWRFIENKSIPTIPPPASVKSDNINHPAHYTDGKIEVIDFIEDKKLPYHLGNVIKYISRAGKKSPDTELEDLKKAQWYLSRYIELKEGNR